MASVGTSKIRRSTANTGTIWRVLLWTALLVPVAVTLWELATGPLLRVETWSPAGLRQVLTLAAVFLLLAVALVRWWWALPLVTVLGLGVWSVASVGLRAPAAVLLVLGAAWQVGCLFLHRAPDNEADAATAVRRDLLALLLGIGALTTVVALTAALPVHRPLTYTIALAVPCVLGWRNWRRLWQRHRRWQAGFSPSLRTRAALALALFPLLLHGLSALAPEVGADALAMHLVIPAVMEHRGWWPFDVGEFTWAVMPMGGNWLFALGYLTGGEAAARQLNYAVLLALAGLLGALAAPVAGAGWAWLAVALLGATPLTQLETGSLFVENLLAALILGAYAFVAEFHERRGTRPLLLAAAMGGWAASVKLTALAYVGPLAAWAFLRLMLPWSGTGRWRRQAGAAVLVFAACAAFPYANAWVRTGNPVFPFARHVFPSPRLEMPRQFDDERWRTPLAWTTPHAVTFASHSFLEAEDGALGLHYFLLLPVCALALARSGPAMALVALGAGLVAWAGIFQAHAYLRYVYPSLPLILLALAVGGQVLARHDRLLGTIAAAVGVVAVMGGVYWLPVAGYWHREFLFATGAKTREAYVHQHSPARSLISWLNRHHPGEPVAFLSSTDVAELWGRAYSVGWHTHRFGSDYRAALTQVDRLGMLRQRGVRLLVTDSRAAEAGGEPDPLTRSLFRLCGERVFAIGPAVVHRLDLACPMVTRPDQPLPPGVYNSSDTPIRYRGTWLPGWFADAHEGDLRFSERPGAEVRVRFRGTGITWLHTKAFNRGQARVALDGRDMGTVDLYAKEVHWRAEAAWVGLAWGEHELRITVLGAKREAATEAYVDVDGFVVQGEAAKSQKNGHDR